MFQEEIADLTANHLRSHISAYLSLVQGIYADGVKLILPKSIETSNLVGGVYNAAPDQMPAIAVDIISKAFLGIDPDSLWTYSYDGHFAGVVSGQSEDVVNKLVKRHEQACEMFVRNHQFMHLLENSKLGNDFRIKGLDFSGAAFSGAELADEENDRQIWIAGFRIDLLWTTSESGPDQHA